MDLSLGLLPYFGFEIWVGGNEQAGLARVDASLRAVEPGGKDLSFWRVNYNFATLHFEIAGCNRAEINAGDYFTVYQHEKTIAREKIRKDGTFFAPTDDFIDAVNDGFEPLELLNFLDDGGLIKIELRALAVKGGPKRAPQAVLMGRTGCKKEPCQPKSHEEGCENSEAGPKTPFEWAGPSSFERWRSAGHGFLWRV